MFKKRTKLIPRYNWDYGFSDLAKAIVGSYKPIRERSEILEKVLGATPILTTSGRTSLYAILKALNLPEGSNVGVPLFCCQVVFDAIRQAKLVPKFIDINLDDYNLSAVDLYKKKESLSAVIAVHMFGHPVDMNSIAMVSGDLPIIEDCAQSLFSRYKGRETGTLSKVSFFSFRSGKYISAGEGSAILCMDSQLRKSINDIVENLDDWTLPKMQLHCLSTLIKSTLYKRPWYGTIGYPIGMYVDKKINLSAKTGFNFSKIAQSDLSIIEDRIGTFIEKVNKQRENALYFLENIKLQNVFLPYEKKECFSNYYQFAIRFKDTNQRDKMLAYLFNRGIDTAKYLDEVIDVATKNYDYQGDCPNAELCSKTVLIIPNHYILSAKDLDYIIDCLNKGAKVTGRS